MNRRFAHNVAMLLGSKGAGAVMGLLYMAVAARALGVEALGVLVLVHSYSVAVMSLASFKSSNAMIRYGSEDIHRGRPESFKQLIRLLFALDLFAAALGTAIGFAAILMVAPWVGINDAVVPWAAAYTLLILFNVRATALGILQLFDRFDLIAVNGLIVPVVRCGGALLAWAFDGGLPAFLLTWFLAGAITGVALPCVGLWELRRRELIPRVRGTLRGATRMWPDFWRFVWISNFHGSLTLAETHVATLIVGAVLGPAAAGLFNVVRQISSALVKLSRILAGAIYPELAKLVNDRRLEHAKRVVFRSMILMALISSQLVILLLIWGSELLSLVFGPEFASADALLVLLGIASGASAARFAINPALYMLGRPDIPFKIETATALAHLSLLVLLAGQFGLTGVGLAALTAGISTTVISSVVCLRQLKKNIGDPTASGPAALYP